MPDPLPRPGVEVEQKFVTASPTITIPALNPCIIGVANYIVEAFNADGTTDTDALISAQYANTLLTVQQADFPDPRSIIGNVDVDETTIRVWISGASGTLEEALRTEAFLAPASPPDTGDITDDLSPGGGTRLFQIMFAGSGLVAITDVKAGDRISIDGGRLIRQISAVAAGTGAFDIDLTLDTDISKDEAGSFTYHIIATSDLDGSGGRTGGALTAFLTIGGAGEAIVQAGFLRAADGSVTTGVNANVFIEYEALRLDLSPNPTVGEVALLTFSDQDQLDTVLAPISLRNPLAVGVLFALINSPTNSVTAIGLDERTTAAPEGTLAAYNRALSFLESKEVYALAPLTQDAVVHQTFSAHVTALSKVENKHERVALINQVQPTNEPDATTVSGSLANTTVRASVITEGADTSANVNALMEQDMGAAVAAAGVVAPGDLIKAGELRDAGLFLQIAGEAKKFPIRTIVGPDLEIIEEAIASDAATAGTDTDKGIIFSAGAGAMAPVATLVTITFAPSGGSLTLEDAGVRVGDLIDLIVQAGGTTDITPDPLVVKSISGNVVTADITAGDRTDLTEFRIRLVSTDYDEAGGGFSSLVIGSPFSNQTWLLATLGAPLIISGTTLVDRDGVADALGTIATAFANRRLLYVQPDSVATTAISGQEDIIPGYYLAAAIAGMTGEQPPQQGFTNFPIAGFTRLINSNETYSDTQMNVAAGGGVYWTVQDAPGAAVISRHQLTTDVSSIEVREFSITKVVDFTAKFLRSGLKRFIGRFNITPEFLDQLATITQGLLSSLTSRGILNGAELRRLAVDENAPDTIIVEIVLDVPFPANFIRITLII